MAQVRIQLNCLRIGFSFDWLVPRIQSFQLLLRANEHKGMHIQW